MGINTKISNNFPQIVENTDSCTSWDDWLDKTEKSLRSLGYKKYEQYFKKEDFAYWKTFGRKYQVGVFFYDFRNFRPDERIGVQFECMFVDVDSRIDLSVSKDGLDLVRFEKMAHEFYNAMAKYTE